MIRGVHTMLYCSQPEALREFLRDKLAFTAHDIGHGWLIFDLPPAEMGVHPASPNPGQLNGTHDVSFFTDDIHGMVKELKARGVEFTQEVTDEGYGLVTYFRAPGPITLQLYQPKYSIPR